MAEIASSTDGNKTFGLMDFWNALAPAAAARAASEILGNQPANGGKPIATVGVQVGLPDWVKYAALAAIAVGVYYLVTK